MALLPKWLNADNWAALRDKINALFDSHNGFAGGTTNQIQAKNSDNDFDIKWVDAPPAIPALEENKFISNNGTDLQWKSIPFDRQVAVGAPNAAYPVSGTSTEIIHLTGAAGGNRDYKLEFTWSFNRISTSPEMHMSFYRNGAELINFHHVPIPSDGHSQVATIHYMDLNIPEGTEYSVVISVSGSTNQYRIQDWFFSIDGTPTVS